MAHNERWTVDQRPISQMRNLGPACEKDLNAVGIYKAQQVIDLGPESTFLQMLLGRKKLGRSMKCCNAAYLYALHGVDQTVHVQALPAVRLDIGGHIRHPSRIRQDSQHLRGRKVCGQSCHEKIRRSIAGCHHQNFQLLLVLLSSFRDDEISLRNIGVPYFVKARIFP